MVKITFCITYYFESKNAIQINTHYGIWMEKHDKNISYYVNNLIYFSYNISTDPQSKIWNFPFSEHKNLMEKMLPLESKALIGPLPLFLQRVRFL